MQVIQAVRDLSIVYPIQYWAIIIGWLLAVCFGWFKLGTMTLAVAGPARRHVLVGWRFKPFANAVLVQVGSVALMAKLESGVDYMAASFAIRIQ